MISISMPSYSQKGKNSKRQSYSAKMENFRVKKKDFKKRRYWSVGGGFSILTYFGDLAPANKFLSTELRQIKPGLNLFVQHQYSPRVSIKGELLFGRLTGDDFTSADPNDNSALSRYTRNLSFRNNIIELSIMPQVQVFKNYLEFWERKKFNIFFQAGVSVFYHNPKAKVPDFKISGERYPNAGEWVALRPLGTEGQNSEYYARKPYSNFQFSVPLGVGITVKLSEKFDFSLDFNYRFLLTDYIDDVSGTYVDLGALDGDLAKSMSDRSQEETAVVTGEKRDLELILSKNKPIAYISQFDGNRYTVLSGHGVDGAVRGGASNDTYINLSFKVVYVLSSKKSSNF